MVHINCIVRARLYGVLADIRVKIEPAKSADKVVLEGRQKVIYAALKNPLYGTLFTKPTILAGSVQCAGILGLRDEPV